MRTTVYLDAAAYRRIKALAKAEGRPAAELIRDAVSEYARRRAEPPLPSSIGMGASGVPDLAERMEALLEGFGES